MWRLALHWQILIGMAAGAVLGIALNAGWGTRQTEIDRGLPANVDQVTVLDSTERTVLRVVQRDGTVRQLVIDPLGRPTEPEQPPGAEAVAPQVETFRTVNELAAQYPAIASRYEADGRSLAKRAGQWCARIGGLFLRLLQMVAVPLIVTSLLTGIMGLGDAGRFGQMFGRTLTYYLSTSFLAILTGLAAVNIIRPGLRGGLVAAAPGGDAPPDVGLGTVLFNQLEAIIPANPLGALVEPNFLSVIAFTLAIAIFALRVGGETAVWLRRAAQVGFDIMMAMTTAIIGLAPVGVFFLMLYVTATQGLGVFQSLAWYMLAVLAALVVHACVTLPLIVRLVARRSPWQFARAMSPALLTAFSSASSNGTLPLTLASAERRAGISNRTGSFVLPLGATVNMDGTALYEVVAVLFIAQLHHGANLPLTQQIIVTITALLASVGAAGIPHAGLVMMVIILQAVGLPVELQGIILAVDRVLDMARTSVNVWSDSCGCAVIEYFESPATVDAAPAVSATG